MINYFSIDHSPLCSVNVTVYCTDRLWILLYTNDVIDHSEMHYTGFVYNNLCSEQVISILIVGGMICELLLLNEMNPLWLHFVVYPI